MVGRARKLQPLRTQIIETVVHALNVSSVYRDSDCAAGVCMLVVFIHPVNVKFKVSR